MSAIYKEGYWYPADSLNTLKAVTISNADYEALTPQEKEELGGIEIFIPDRPLTCGGTGAVIIYNGVEYAGTPTSRLDNLEEIVGNGQQSVGNDLTDAVTQLNSSFTNSTTYSTDTTERVLIGYKQGKPLYRQYLTYSNLTVPVNTEQILTSASIPSGAGNISISDKSYIETGTTRMNACCANSNVYSVDTSIRWRQTYSSSSSWNLYIWVEYTLPN